MTTTVVQNEPTFKGHAAPGDNPPTLAAWFLHRQRNAAMNRNRDPFNRTAWLKAITASDLSAPVKDTAEHIADSTDWYGVSAISRDDLAAAAGVTRVATITARTKRLEEAGYITTERRFNKTSTLQLAFPYDA